MNQQLGIIVALTREARSIRTSDLVSGKPIQLSSNHYLYISGMGKDCARYASERLIEIGCTHLISWGCCAALHRDLKPGDVIIPDTITSVADSLSLRGLNPETQQVLEQNESRIINGLYSDCKHLLVTREDKSELYNSTKAVAADMESYAIAKTASQIGISCTIIRAVSDEVDMTIPQTITCHIDQYGETVLPDFALALLKNPLQLYSLIKLGRGFNRAMKSLQKISNAMFV